MRRIPSASVNFITFIKQRIWVSLLCVVGGWWLVVGGRSLAEWLVAA